MISSNSRQEKVSNGYFALRQINPVIKFLTVADILIIGGFGLISPIFAIFVLGSIKGGNIEVAGTAVALYLLAKSVVQIPTASIVDRIKGEIDDFWLLLFGSVVYSVVPLMYLIIDTPLELYGVQLLYGFATAVTLPTWYAIFTRHVDRENKGLEWGIYQTLVDLGGAGTASLGGFLAYRFGGFTELFILVSIVSLIGTAFLVGVYKHLWRQPKVLDAREAEEREASIEPIEK